ncbi:MAG: Gfo/Idh/MocA family oxidoreductase [Tannerella sp.]|nr:Gfo/Idh/MocA family oxidoreductase [Tannerella sp.]
MNRRNFIKSSSALAAGMALPIIGKAAAIAPASDTLNIALIGCGGMGRGDAMDIMRNPGVRCVAVCDVCKGPLEAAVAEITKMQDKRPDTYSDYRKVLDRKDVDAVVIATPDHWHCRIFADACMAGKDIYCEKPAGNSIGEVEAMVAVAKKYNRVVQVGQQQRSSRHFHEMIEYLRSGKLGRIGRIHVWANFTYIVCQPPVADTPAPDDIDWDFWLGPAAYRPYNANLRSWRNHFSFGGGLITDWGVHLLDMGLWAKDIKTPPLRTLSGGGKLLFPDRPNDTFDTLSVTYQFDDFIMTWENSGGVTTAPYGKEYGFLYQGENGLLVADRDSWTVYPEKGKALEITVKGNNDEAHRLHTANFYECVKSRNTNTACTIENGALCATYAHLGNIAMRLGGGSLTYNAQTHTFDRAEAAKYFRPEYRSPWQFPQ